MSTKQSIAWADEFHFYRDMFDEEHVYLDLHPASFEAHEGRICVAIPAAIWQTIRGYRFDLSAAGASDAELESKSARLIDEQIYRETEHAAQCVGEQCRLKFFYHRDDEGTREERIAQQLGYELDERRKQEAIAAKVAEFATRSRPAPLAQFEEKN